MTTTQKKTSPTLSPLSEMLLALSSDALALVYDWNKEGRSELSDLLAVLQRKADAFISRRKGDWRGVIAAEKKFLTALMKQEERVSQKR